MTSLNNMQRMHTSFGHCLATTCIFLLAVVSSPALAQKTEDTKPAGVAMAKGTWFAGGTVSAGSRLAENENQLFAFVVDQDKRHVEVRIDGGYLFRKNLGAGLGLLYGRTKENITTKSTDGIITDKQSAGDYYAFRPFIKNFLPLGKSHQFYVVIPTELQLGFGNKVTESVTDAVLTRTYSSSTFYGIALRPGILAFIHKNFGFEVNVGAFGINSSTEKTTTTNQLNSKVRTNNLDLRINVLSLALGFTGYF